MDNRWLTFRTSDGVVRVLDRGDSCELRYRNTLLIGNNDLRELLLQLATDSSVSGLEHFGASRGLSFDAITERLERLLKRMAAAGIPLNLSSSVSSDPTMAG